MEKSENIWTNQYNPFQRFKVLAWYDRMKSIQKGIYQAPVNIALDICQGTKNHKLCGGFNCNFCMSNLEDVGRVAYIPEKILLEIPRFYFEWGVKSICLAGHNSDPTMYRQSVLIKFLELCKKWNVEVGFVSNGAFYTQKLLEAVAETCNWSGWSINASTAKTHFLLTGMPEKTFDRIISNIQKMAIYKNKRNLDHDIGYKYLITNENYNEILIGVELANKIGVRHFQIRPCELPEWRRKKIDVNIVEQQIKEALKYERPGEFEIFGIREKFNPDFSKKPPKRCIASPLGSTWKADGDIVICPDRRWSAHQPNMVLGNFIKDGFKAIVRKWNGIEHQKMIDAANADINKCIRCTSFSWHEIYEECIEKDSLDITLI